MSAIQMAQAHGPLLQFLSTVIDDLLERAKGEESAEVALQLYEQACELAGERDELLCKLVEGSAHCDSITSDG